MEATNDKNLPISDKLKETELNQFLYKLEESTSFMEATCDGN